MFEELDFAAWREVTSVILDGAYLCAHAALPHLRRSDTGSIVTIGGMSAHSGSAGPRACHGSQGGIVGLTRALAIDLGPDGITANCVVPALSTPRARRRRRAVSLRTTASARRCWAAVAGPKRWRPRSVISAGRWPATSPARRCTSTEAPSFLEHRTAPRRHVLVSARQRRGPYHGRGIMKFHIAAGLSGLALAFALANPAKAQVTTYRPPEISSTIEQINPEPGPYPSVASGWGGYSEEFATSRWRRTGPRFARKQGPAAQGDAAVRAQRHQSDAERIAQDPRRELREWRSREARRLS